MTAVIQEPWDRISNMSVAFKLDKHNENCRCWKEKERKDDDVDDKASATTNKTLLEIQEHFRTKTIDLATHMTEYIESIMQVEQKINQTITHGIMTSFDSIQHKIQHIISDTAALRPGSKNVAYRWKSRIVAFYSSSQPTPGLFPSSSSSTSSPISTFLRLQIAIFTQPIFTILRPILTSTPTLEEELYLALDSKFFDSKFYTQKQDIIDSIKAIGPKRHQAHLHLNSLISDFAVIHAYHPTFVRKFREMKPWLNPYSSLSASKNTKDSSEEVEHTLRSAAAAATTMGNSIDLKQADAADTVWWGPVLTSVIEVRIYGRIKRFARDLRRLQAEGGVLSMADAKMLIDEKGSG
ncbi:hypothetical protein AC578_5903 [Pseudocercospora eumusae]|uniref:Uncharacterized protein n=1 Tax=Pseudocercospora eumusae TaxID=321146 RepID=A0A139HBG7_9PEZI|nr:hypothetical protein AC578_5903 [Pseudocercospora eumusae]